MAIENSMVNDRHWKYREPSIKTVEESHVDRLEEDGEDEDLEDIGEVIIPYHIYECEECIVSFAVEQAFEDQSEVKCPICSTDDFLRDVCAGQMLIRR
jgi:rubrerythrin